MISDCGSSLPNRGNGSIYENKWKWEDENGKTERRKERRKKETDQNDKREAEGEAGKEKKIGRK